MMLLSFVHSSTSKIGGVAHFLGLSQWLVDHAFDTKSPALGDQLFVDGHGSLKRLDESGQCVAAQRALIPSVLLPSAFSISRRPVGLPALRAFFW
jgi:hypothetical protein